MANSNDCNLKTSLLNINYDLSRDIVYDELPSLKQITVRRFSLFLWEYFIENKNSLLNHFFSSLESETDESFSFKSFGEKVFEKFGKNKLLLPKVLLDGLMEMVLSMNTQIQNFLDALQNLELLFNVERKNLYLDSIKWTSQCTINRPNTALLLIESFKISSIEKFKLASYYCLKDQVCQLMKELPDHFIKDFVNDEKFFLMVYWIYKFVEDRAVIEIVRNSEHLVDNYEDVLDWAIVENHEIAVHYIGENFMRKYSWNHMILFVQDTLLYSETNNILVYLLTQSGRVEDIEDICVALGYDILNRIVNDSRWCNYFSFLSKHILSYMCKMNLCDAVSILMLCWNLNTYEEGQVKMLIEKLGLIHNININLPFLFSSCVILNVLFSLENVKEDTMKRLLSIGCVEEGRKFLYSKVGQLVCMNLITYEHLDVLDMFLKEMLTAKNEIDSFKAIFFEMSGTDLYVLFKMNEEKQVYNALDNFLSSFCKNKISEFKKSLPYQKQGKIVGDILKSMCGAKEKVLKAVDTFLSWCFEGEKSEIHKCKSILFDLEVNKYNYSCQIFTYYMCWWIRRGHCNRAERYISWAFSANSDIDRFKEKLAVELEKPEDNSALDNEPVDLEGQAELYTNFLLKKAV